jgi:nucleoside-diphosphate-sugar epimerase
MAKIIPLSLQIISNMILVTGGTGLVGSHLLYKLTSLGETPLALKRPSSDISRTRKVFSYYSDNSDDLFNKIVWIDGDILDYSSILEAMEGVNKVYHTAASVSFQSSDKQNLIATNITGTANIVVAALEKNISKLVHISTIGALGRAESSGVVTEETHWNSKKSSVYSTSKYNAEMEVWRGIAEGLNAVIINPSIILGPGEWNTGSSKLFSAMYSGLKFYSIGSNGFVDVEDVAESMIQLMNSDIAGERFIINSENISYKQFFTWMANSLNVAPPKYKAGTFLSGIGWRLLWVKGLVTGKKSTITRETAETACQSYDYSNKKIKQELGIDFISVKDSLDKNAKLFLRDL